MSEARFACFLIAPRARLFGFIIMPLFIFEGAYHDLQPEGLSPPERSEHNLPPSGGHNTHGPFGPVPLWYWRTTFPSAGGGTINIEAPSDRQMGERLKKYYLTNLH